MNISVVVVTWNGMHLLRPCLDALAEQTVPYELVVVDNGSDDRTVPWIKRHHPAARLVTLHANLGFAGGNNAGLRAARGDLLVLLNNDTAPPPTFLAEITCPFAQSASVGAVAGVLTFAHRPELVASAGIVVGRDGVHRDARALTRVADLPIASEEIFGASGGAVCFQRAALADVGLFEDRFFNYLEDADLAWRLRLRDWSCWLAPRAVLPHIYSATSGHNSPAKQRRLALNRWRVIIRCFPGALLWSNALPILRYDLLATLYGLATGNSPILSGRLQALRELAQLRRERKRILRFRTAEVHSLKRWIEPAPSARAVLREARRLDQVLRDRK